MSNRCTLQELLDHLAGEDSDRETGAVSLPSLGYIQAPNLVAWVRREGNTLWTSRGPVDTDQLEWVYDLRLFNDVADIHWWWNEDHGLWFQLEDAAVVKPHMTPMVGHPNQQRRILRGTAREHLPGGWTTMWDGQAAPYDLPIEVPLDGRAYLEATEYVAREDDLGNVSIVAERLAGPRNWEERDPR
ncbi:MAG: CRISPR-associated protein Csx19 [Ancrocorticia sp.]